MLNSNVEDAKKRVAMQREAGLRDRFFTPQETAQQFPYVDPESIQGSTWCPSDGFLRPALFGEAANACRRLGVEIYQKSPINKSRLKRNKIEVSEPERRGWKQTCLSTAPMLGLHALQQCSADNLFPFLHSSAICGLLSEMGL